MAADLFEAGAHRVEFGTPQGLSTAEGAALLYDRVLPELLGTSSPRSDAR
jgi:hypothetical protein